MKLIFSVLDRHELWPIFRDYYKAQGITQFLCVTYGPRLNGVTHIPAPIPPREFNGDRDAQFHNAVIDEYVKPSEWYAIADLDEFVVFPDGSTLCEAVARATKDGANLIWGNFRDRITADGSIPTQLEQDIWKQFPLKTNATEALTGGCSTKITAAVGKLHLRGGHHNITDESWKQGKRWQTYSEVHHFKWWGELLAPRFKALPCYQQELDQLEQHIQANNGININDLEVFE
jgi:hypothetical protein